MRSDGVLLLSHVGYSFMEDLIEILDKRGLRSFVLTSSPLAAERDRRLGELRERASWLQHTDDHVLGEKDVERALAQLREQGERVLFCVSVWEGYRDLMARANAQLGINDLSVAEVVGVRDKLGVRNRLADAGLSGARAMPLDSCRLDELKRAGSRYFIKPRSGIASYGTFPLREDTSWLAIEDIMRQATDDIVYRSVFGGSMSFIAEEYIEGCEFSFEAIVIDARPYVLAIHEKCELTESAGTTLENSCTSPPHTLSYGDNAAGIAWIAQILRCLGLRWGCYHIEARFDGRRWDLVEVNPRVGGSLISHSVKSLNGRFSMLELWVDSLLAQVSGAAVALPAFVQQLNVLSYRTDGTPPTADATFFRVYYASPGCIEYVGPRVISRQPVISQILLKPGDQVNESAREVFLGQMLWRLSREERDANIDELARESVDAVEVRYVSNLEQKGVRP